LTAPVSTASIALPAMLVPSRPGLGHRHEPLVGEHRLDDLAGANADRHRVLVRHRLLEEVLRLEVAQHGLLAS
jgi:hypothetical protein